jgi:hypothetical protein
MNTQQSSNSELRPNLVQERKLLKWDYTIDINVNSMLNTDVGTVSEEQMFPEQQNQNISNCININNAKYIANTCWASML